MKKFAYTGYTLLTTLALLLATTRPGKAQVTTVQDLGAIAASAPWSGLGWNLTMSNEWEFKAAAAAGAQHARFQCGWESTETQSAAPDNTNAASKYVLQDNCRNALLWSKKYGLQPTIVAAYGPPYHPLLNFTVPGGAAVGATSLSIQFANGVNGATFANLRQFYDLLMRPDGSKFTAVRSYGGSLVTGVKLTDATHATLTLASAVSVALPADATTYTVNELLYPPPFDFSATNPSVVAYSNYAFYLASQIAAFGLRGEVELWNEPAWGDDPWDQGQDFYDNFTAYPVPNGPTMNWLANFGFVTALQSRTDVPAGVTFNWAGTHKTGDQSVFGENMRNSGNVFLAGNKVVTSESYHPYGNNPEDLMWSEPCLQQANATTFYSCPINAASTSNMFESEYWNVAQQRINPRFAITHTITETNIDAAHADSAHAVRFALRQYLGFQAAHVSVIEFYRLYDPSAELTFFNPQANPDGSYTPRPNYIALAGLISDLAPIQNAPVAPYSPDKLTAISTYTGTYKLNVVHMVGSRTGDAANSELVAIWQNSQVPNDQAWGSLAQPANAPVALTLPAGTLLASVTNLATRAAVPYTLNGRTVSFTVSDDPIAILVIPAPVLQTATVAVNPGSAAAAASTVKLSSTIVYTGSVAPIGTVTFAVDHGVGIAGTCTGSASPLTCSASYPSSGLTSGSHTVLANLAADTNFAAAAGSGTLNVAAADFSFTVLGPTLGSLVKSADASYAFTLAPTAGQYPQAVTLSVSGLPSGAVYSFTPNSFASNAGVQPVLLNVSRGGAAQVRQGPLSGVGLTALCALLLLPLPASRRLLRRRSRGLLVAILALTAAMTALTGCGVNVQGSQTYTLTVTATSGAVQHSNEVALTF